MPIASETPRIGARHQLTRLGIGAGVVIPALMLLYVKVGSHGDHAWSDIFAHLRHGPYGDHWLTNVIWMVRLPRLAVVMLVGWILGAVGCAFQAVFRNALAEPYIVGVSSGAATGGALALVAGVSALHSGVGVLMAGFVGGLTSLALVYRLGRAGGRSARVSVSQLLLAGVTVSALLSALLSFILMLAGHDTNRVLGFLLGHTSDASWPKAAILAPVALVGTVLLVRSSRQLAVLSLGDAVATSLGLDPRRVVLHVLLIGTAMTSAAVGAVGIVGFVGLVAPHLARLAFGLDWRVNLPAAAAIGSGLMVVADLIAQRGLAEMAQRPGMEVNVGIVAALIGAPSLLVLLRNTAHHERVQ
ncbi:MAG: iron ABC transporter permease [Fimbriimonadaceae bacterium]|nr:iron ABC transporter permease [Fimbriimonadaceae bacterium]